MPKNTPSRENAQREKMLTTYNKLPQYEAWLLRLLSVIYIPVEHAELARCIGRCGRSALELHNSLNRLAKSGLLEISEQTVSCSEILREPLSREEARLGTFSTTATAVRESIWRGRGFSEREMPGYEHALSRLRVALYQKNAPDCRQIIDKCQKVFPEDFQRCHPYSAICTNPFDPVWAQNLPPRLLLDVLSAVMADSVKNLRPEEEAFDTLKKFCAGQENDSIANLLLVPQWIYRGKFPRARKLLKGRNEPEALALSGWLELASGAPTKAIKFFEKVVAAGRPLPSMLEGLLELCYICEKLPREYKNPPVQGDSLEHLFTILDWLRERISGTTSQKAPELSDDTHPIAALVHFLCLLWEDSEELKQHREKIEELFQQSKTAGYIWLAAEAAEILAHTESAGNNTWAGKLAVIRKACKSSPLRALLRARAGWERPLQALAQLPAMLVQQPGSSQEERLAWQISVGNDSDIYEIIPVEQHRTADGNWGRGRRISLQRLFEESQHINFLTEQDRQVCSAIAPVLYGHGRGSRTEYEINYDKALPLLAGHPLIFRQDAPDVRVELTLGEPELLAQKLDDKLLLRLEPQISADTPVCICRETPTRLRVVRSSRAHAMIAKVLGRGGLQLPTQAYDQAAEIIEKLSHFVTVQSDIGISPEISEDCPADERLRVQIMPVRHGLRVEILIRPFGEAGAYYRPGAGARNILAEIEGKRLRTSRNLSRELELADSLTNRCPILKNAAVDESGMVLEDVLDCLELLLQLQEAEDDILLEWPQGGRMSVCGQSSLSALSVQIKRENDWFEMSGNLKVDEDLVIDMARLLEMSRHSRGRFVPIGKNRYIALTESFRQRLDEIRSYADVGQKGARLHPLAAMALEDLSSQAGEFEADIEWKKLAGRLRQTEEVPVPQTLQAKLRDYQLDGYNWLQRLSQWGMGACLADDMGLGKTVQTLALLLQRAQHGPALVIAPTSVCFNWIEEAARFAPTLRPQLFGPGDREMQIKEAGKFDIVVCSYALLQQQQEIISTREWNTVVLDEAQAIKNYSTKRARAAFSLKAGFRLATTGTPVENHLGEIWSIFNFLNPGLLGSIRRFKARFAEPIERDRDVEAARRLRKLLSPFILRRLKSEVLQELPPRTEIIKHIELSSEESAFYEALRRDALTGLQSSNTENEGQRKVRILAQIMRLRRACCNPTLVDGQSIISSSKLEEFGEIVHELLDNGHKALIFSQFVDHLQIIRNYLQKENISHQYLDGSTPAAKRQGMVEKFQSGEGDLFLISLKAGGQGLNLTAADYVIHMDPWWNPAVEDQASDRSHRIGQQRPVTIYRLITRGTIEEKIVELHTRKRELAQGLLEGTDSATAFSSDELMQMLRENIE